MRQSENFKFFAKVSKWDEILWQATFECFLSKLGGRKFRSQYIFSTGILILTRLYWTIYFQVKNDYFRVLLLMIKNSHFRLVKNNHFLFFLRMNPQPLPAGAH